MCFCLSDHARSLASGTVLLFTRDGARVTLSEPLRNPVTPAFRYNAGCSGWFAGATETIPK
jgi:hypothetical protein